jgi:hypothetical protein
MEEFANWYEIGNNWTYILVIEMCLMGMFGMAIQFSQGYYLFDKRNKLMMV